MIDIFRYDLVRKICFVFVCICVLQTISSCKKRIQVIQNINFIEVLQLSKQKQKPIFLIIGGGESCIPCHTIKRQLSSSRLLNQYKDDFIFYLCNVNKPENDFIYKTLLPQTIPNYYIIDTSGDIVAFSFAPVDDERIHHELMSYLAGHPKCYDIHNGFSDLSTDSLLRMQSLLLKANLFFNEKDYLKSLEHVEKSITIYPYLYNHYLQYKVNLLLGNTRTADSLAYIAVQYDKHVGNQSIIYEEYIKELNTKCANKEVDTSRAFLQLIDPVIKCGEMSLGTCKTYEFKFINSGTSPLVVLNVSYSCGCTKPSWKRTPVKQNDTGVIYVDFKADSKGEFSRSLVIQSNASNSIEKIVLKGIIK